MGGGRVSTRLREIRSLARSLDVQRAVVSADSFEPERMLDLICTMEAIGVKVSVLPRMLEVVGSSVEFDDLDGGDDDGDQASRADPLIDDRQARLRPVRRDLGLLAVAPVLLAIALAIRLGDSGPVLFRQRRVGRHGQHFEVYKFRTMVPDADALKASLRSRNEAQDGLFKIADDPRITRVGRCSARAPWTSCRSSSTSSAAR